MFAGIESIDAGGQGTYFLAYIRRIKVSQVGGISAYLIEEMPHLTQGKQLHSWGRGLGDGSDIYKEQASNTSSGQMPHQE